MKTKGKIISALATIVLSVAVLSGTWPCIWIWHQPRIPEGIKKLRSK